MTVSAADSSQIRYARLAGLMYLLVDAGYALGFYILSHFQVPGNFAETAHRIAASEQLYRFGLSIELIGALFTVFLAMGLYVAVRPINGNLALLALVFRLVEAILFGVQVIFSFAALNLYTNPEAMNAFGTNQLTVLVNLRSVANLSGFNVAGIFFSMGSVLFFYLFFKSTYIPKSLSALGVFGSMLVPIVCFASLIWPQHADMLFIGWAPCGAAEIIAGFWLLFKGLKLPAQTATTEKLATSV